MRSILCPSCSAKFTMHPEDIANDWHMRNVEIKVKVPTDGSHRIEIMAGDEPVKVIHVPVVLCDHCNHEIPEGATGIAVSMWRGEDEPGNWEQGYSQ